MSKENSWGKLYCNKCGKYMGGHFLEEYGEYEDVLDEIMCKECYKKQLKIEKETETKCEITEWNPSQ